MQRLIIGNTVSGASIALGLWFVMPADRIFTWSWFIAMFFICFGTSIGDAISHGK